MLYERDIERIQAALRVARVPMDKWIDITAVVDGEVRRSTWAAHPDAYRFLNDRNFRISVEDESSYHEDLMTAPVHRGRDNYITSRLKQAMKDAGYRHRGRLNETGKPKPVWRGRIFSCARHQKVFL